MQLIPFDSTNNLHVDITYEILQKRFDTDYINIQDFVLPTREQHITNILSDRYKYYYLIEYDNYIIGIIYIINPNNELGFFLHAINATTAYRKNKHYLYKEIENVQPGDSKIKKVIYFYIKSAFNKLREMHPELTKLTSKVNVNNEVSREGTEYIGFKPKHIYYEFE